MTEHAYTKTYHYEQCPTFTINIGPEMPKTTIKKIEKDSKLLDQSNLIGPALFAIHSAHHQIVKPCSKYRYSEEASSPNMHSSYGTCIRIHYRAEKYSFSCIIGYYLLFNRSNETSLPHKILL